MQDVAEESIGSKKHTPSFGRPKNLKRLVNSKPTSHGGNTTVNNAGCFKCNKKCDFCTNFVEERNSFTRIKT